MGDLTEDRILAGITVFFTRDHHRRGGACGPEVALLLIQTNAYRYALRQANPLEVRIDGRHPFCIIGTAGVGHPRGHAVHGSLQDPVAAERRDFGAIARTHAFQLGLFHIGEDVEGVLFHQRHGS